MTRESPRTRIMDIFLPFLVLAAWFVLGRWVLPRLGVPT